MLIMSGAPSSSRSFLPLVLPPTSIELEDHIKNGFRSAQYRFTTAGLSRASVNGLRARTGSSVSIFRSTVFSIVDVLNWTPAATSPTLTCWLTLPRVRTALTVTSPRT